MSNARRSAVLPLMQQKISTLPARKVITNTEVVVVYNPTKKFDRRWARRQNCKLTTEGLELAEYEPGRAVYRKRNEQQVSND